MQDHDTPPDDRSPRRHDDDGRRPRRAPMAEGFDGSRTLDELLAGVGDLLLVEAGLDDAMATCLFAAQASLAGTAEVSVTVSGIDGDRDLATRGATAPFAEELDRWQYEHSEGPCVESDRTGEVIVVRDVAHDDRFPAFREVALDRGVLATASFPLPAGHRSVGSLNVFLQDSTTIDEDFLHTCRRLARSIAPVLANWLTHQQLHDVRRQLETALETRAVIERAKGLLMARLDVDEDRAFEVLRAQSQHTNTKVHDVAALLLQQATAGAPTTGD